jgi:hypothetical protein
MAKKRRRIWLATHQGRVYCCSGRPNTCNNLSLLSAEESQFHDDKLSRATAEVNDLFARLHAEAPAGTHLALIDTTFGLLLAWVEGIDRPDDISEFVRAESPEEEIRQALGLEDDVSAAAA